MRLRSRRPRRGSQPARRRSLMMFSVPRCWLATTAVNTTPTRAMIATTLFSVMTTTHRMVAKVEFTPATSSASRRRSARAEQLDVVARSPAAHPATGTVVTTPDTSRRAPDRDERARGRGPLRRSADVDQGGCRSRSRFERDLRQHGVEPRGGRGQPRSVGRRQCIGVGVVSPRYRSRPR